MMCEAPDSAAPWTMLTPMPPTPSTRTESPGSIDDGVDRRPDPGLHRTADDARHVERDVAVDADHALFGHDHLVGPRRQAEPPVDRLAATAQTGGAVGQHRGGDRHGVGADVEQPLAAVGAVPTGGVGGQHHMVAEHERAHPGTELDHDTGSLVPDDRRAHRRKGAPHQTDVGVTYTACDDTDPDLTGAGRLQLDVVDDLHRRVRLSGEQRCTHFRTPVTSPGRSPRSAAPRYRRGSVRSDGSRHGPTSPDHGWRNRATSLRSSSTTSNDSGTTITSPHCDRVSGACRNPLEEGHLHDHHLHGHHRRQGPQQRAVRQRVPTEHRGVAGPHAEGVDQLEEDERGEGHRQRCLRLGITETEEHRERADHDHHGRGHDPHKAGARQDHLVTFAWRLVHDARLGRIHAERDRRRPVGDDVHEQDLDRVEGHSADRRSGRPGW